MTNFDVPRMEAMTNAGVEIATNQARPLWGGAAAGRESSPKTLHRAPLTPSLPPPFLPPQVQYSLLDRRPTVAMAEFCASKGIGLLPYGVVGGGFLSDRCGGEREGACVGCRQPVTARLRRSRSLDTPPPHHRPSDTHRHAHTTVHPHRSYLGADVKDARADTYSKGKYASVLVESLGGWGGLQRLLAGLKPIADKARAARGGGSGSTGRLERLCRACLRRGFAPWGQARPCHG